MLFEVIFKSNYLSPDHKWTSKVSLDSRSEDSEAAQTDQAASDVLPEVEANTEGLFRITSDLSRVLEPKPACCFADQQLASVKYVKLEMPVSAQNEDPGSSEGGPSGSGEAGAAPKASREDDYVALLKRSQSARAGSSKGRDTAVELKEEEEKEAEESKGEEKGTILSWESKNRFTRCEFSELNESDCS